MLSNEIANALQVTRAFLIRIGCLLPPLVELRCIGGELLLHCPHVLDLHSIAARVPDPPHNEPESKALRDIPRQSDDLSGSHVSAISWPEGDQHGERPADDDHADGSQARHQAAGG
ncbi:MAG: hypothetical protein E6G57_16565 [Actinobacteria bacterium]|nr:MAG: hypothetical protein E6G57_16565 [Actinomycetota bacterium]